MRTERRGSRRPPPDTIVTGFRFSAPPQKVWDGLMFYEQIDRRPPLFLRLLLPVPMRAEGRRSAVGDETRCVYDRGHLLKRVTRIDERRHYGFDVAEQDLAIGGGIRLMGGCYRLLAMAGGATRVELETRYVGRARPRWLWRRIEAVVCHSLHRHILGAMHRAIV